MQNLKHTKNMKKVLFLFLIIFSFSLFTFSSKNSNVSYANGSQPKLAIVIDDFGGYEQYGVETLLDADCILTCAVMPFVDNTQLNLEQLKNSNHEIIMHMPMQSHVELPENWYGPVYIASYDTKYAATEKLKKCLNEFEDIKGFNIHIGSGVSRNKELMKTIYNFAKEHNLYFLDSRTIETSIPEEACKETNSIYLGRDVFLEANKNRSYQGVRCRLLEAANVAKEKGYAIAIGHIGAEGGENTAKAIVDTIDEIKAQGIKIVTLSEIYENLKLEKMQNCIKTTEN